MSKLVDMFRESSMQVTKDMDVITGRTPEAGPPIGPYVPDLTPEEITKMMALIATSGRNTPAQETYLADLISRYVANGHPDPRTAPPAVDADGNVIPSAGSFGDFSSPLNTIVKSIFFLSLAPMFAGSIHFYFISVGCAAAILYSLTKIKTS